MSEFTAKQLQELEARYGLKQIEETVPVKDGVATKTTSVWWCSSDGPECVIAGDPAHWSNIKQFPQVYRLRKPIIRVQYIDE